jgi:hypothetical protein
MRLSSIIRGIEDVVIGTSSKVGRATNTLYKELELEAAARHAANVELRAQKAQLIAEFREVIVATDARFAARRTAASVVVEPSDVDLGGSRSWIS